ncbi:hypothetical protein OG21DRAFT_1506297 [Imleria badia]|nr:hypothetical protein OG21DRAFT_1506297 [Imleria badia]
MASSVVGTFRPYHVYMRFVSSMQHRLAQTFTAVTSLPTVSCDRFVRLDATVPKAVTSDPPRSLFYGRLNPS